MEFCYSRYVRVRSLRAEHDPLCGVARRGGGRVHGNGNHTHTWHGEGGRLWIQDLGPQRLRLDLNLEWNRWKIEHNQLSLES